MMAEPSGLCRKCGLYRQFVCQLVASTICIAIAGISLTAQADAVAAKVSRDGKRFSIDFTINVDAPASEVFALLTDYRNLADISPSTIYSGWIDSNLLRVEIHSCVMVFCKTMTKLSRVVQDGAGAVIYDGVQSHTPFRSSFAYSRERLSVMPGEVGQSSVVSYKAELETAFSVPVIVRAWMVRYVLIRDLKATLANVQARIAGEVLPDRHALTFESNADKHLD